MARKIVIAFDPTGEARAVQDDILASLDLGRMAMERASTVEWNETGQEWEVRFTDSQEVVYRHPSREQCIAWEVKQLQAAL